MDGNWIVNIQINASFLKEIGTAYSGKAIITDASELDTNARNKMLASK